MNVELSRAGSLGAPYVDTGVATADFSPLKLMKIST
jgi:hypothetical protein